MKSIARFSIIKIMSLVILLACAIPFGGCKRGEETEVSAVRAEATATLTFTESPPEPTETATALPSPTQAEMIATVNVISLRVREGPGTNTFMIAGLRFGNTITLEGRNGDGSWVKFDQGWVAADFLDVEGEIASLPIITGEVDMLEIAGTTVAISTLTPTPTPTSEETPGS